MTRSSFTDFFVHHPVFAWVVNIILILLGLATFFQLATRQYPSTEGSVVTVKANMEGPGKILETQVTRPLEDAFSALQGLDHMESSTQKDETRITLAFQNRSLDAAAADVRDVCSRVQLPEGVSTVITKGDMNAAAVIELVLIGDDVPLSELHHTAENTLKSAFESIPGVAMVEVAGGSDFQMSIFLDSLKMEAYQVTASEVVSALRRHNFQRSAGRLRDTEGEFPLTTQASLKTPKEFNDIVVTQHEDKAIRISDIGSAIIRVADEDIKVSYNGKPGISLSLKPQAGASPVDISKAVRAKIQKMVPSLPAGSKIEIALDKAVFIKDSIYQVYRALFEAIILVLVVIFIFLRSFKASVIPLITIPISLVGTFFIMYFLGFSINILSLLALVLAIGLVVDDAIVVLENIYRHIEAGKSPFEAALLGTREIRFSIVAMTLTLAAVYAPIAIAPGTVGKVFKEFALTLAGAVILSGFVALTLSPPMCARLLTPHAEAAAPNAFSQKIDAFLAWLDQIYHRGILWSLSHKERVVGCALAFSLLSGLAGWLYLKKELSPDIDEGILSIRFSAGPSKNLSYIANRAPQVDELLKKTPEVSTRLLLLQTLEESSSLSALLPWGQRHRSCRDIASSLNKDLPNLLGLDGRARCRNSSIISTGRSLFPLSFHILTSRSAEELVKFGRRIRAMLRTFPGIEYIDISEMIQQPEYEIKVDRERAGQFGIDPGEIAETFHILIRGSNVGRFEMGGKTYPVRVWVGEQARRSLENLASLPIRGRDKEGRAVMIPAQEIISFEQKAADAVIEHHDKKRAYHVAAMLKPGYSLGDLYTSFKKLADVELPPGYEIEPAGELKRYFKEQGSIYLIFGLSLLFIFLVMAAQFESFAMPFIIILSVPLALGGAVLSLFILKNGSLNVYSQIGLITLVGLITRHGILLVDFAEQRRKEGKDVRLAIIEACALRFRPIVMTTFAMVLGSLPLAIAQGPGAEARRQIGVVIVGGMSLGTLFTLFVIPVIYVLFTQFRKSLSLSRP